MSSVRYIVILLATFGLLIVAGCGGGGSPADQAAQELYDITVEAKKLASGGGNLSDLGKMMEFATRAAEASKKFQEEYAKLSDAERKALVDRWSAKFKSVGLDSPGS